MNVIGVEFDNDEKTYYLDSNNLIINRNDNVIAQIDKGLFFGIVTDINVKKCEVDGQVVRIADKKDINYNKKNIEESHKAKNKCKELVNKYGINMNIIDATFSFNREQLLFHFYSEDRVDFRNLAKDLAGIYKTRIELRQIGVRDKAKKTGGYGSCGQKLCCSRYLNEFDSISITMAKNQNISLNPNKINGVCGRLLCCLKYENENYVKCKKILPKVGEKKEIDGNVGKVISVNILKQTYKIELPNQNIIEVKIDNGSN